MDNTILIRTAKTSDAPAFRQLRLQALREHPEAFSSDYAVNAAHPDSFWEGRLAEMGEQGMLFFALHEENLVGMCGIQRDYSPKTCHSAMIWGVYVQPLWRSQQLAGKLIASCLDWAGAHKVTIVKLAVVTTNTAAIRCYARSGFQVYGVEPAAILSNGVSYDELLMARPL
jgi:RimJ/RimL family protein N-acetyltransferase